MNRTALPLVLLAATLSLPVLGGCPSEGPATGGGTVQPAAPIVRVSPRVGGRGMDMDVRLRGVNTQWQEGDVSFELGGDVIVNSVIVEGPNFATANISIDDNAMLGYRAMTVRYPSADGTILEHTTAGDEGFLVQTGGVLISPDTVRLGETVSIDIEGFNTNFQDGTTWVDFGEGVFVNWVEVDDDTHATASVSIDQRAIPGLHDVTVFNGPDGWTLMDGLFIDRSAIAIEIDPDNGNQGESLFFTIRGRNTHWVDSGARQTMLDLGTSICVEEFWPDCQDTVRPGGPVDVNSPTQAGGRMDISNGAIPGFYDVRVYVMEEQDFDGNFLIEPDEYVILEEVILHDGFEVREVPVDCNDTPGVSFGFNISRQFNNDNCTVQESVSASAIFYTPLDPPCGAPGPMPPAPYDVNGILPLPGAADCPSPRTCDAGPFVYLEGNVNTITLVRQENSFTGDIFYVPDRALTLDDYPFSQEYEQDLGERVHYDLVADPGSDDPSQIPAFRASDVLFTLPSDFELLSPILCENYTHVTDTDLPLRWTPASTYDVAGLSASITTTDADGNAFQLIVFPWDDGAFDWDGDVLSGLPPGGGTFSFGAGVGQPKWFLDFGQGPVGLENQGRSGLGYGGIITLQAPPDEAPAE
jgi:hypothetical protein